ncbi:MAG: alpha/beta fold hydrolase [Dehalococcoidia bacterium]
MIAVEERFHTVGGYNTYYRVAGAGRPVVLVHGMGGSSLTFRWNIEELAEHFRVYAVDLPGHGRSEKPDLLYLIEDAVPFLAAFITEVCAEPAALVGVSAGGLMCAHTAAARPDLVSHLVMVSTAGLGRDIDWGLRLLSLPALRSLVENGRQDPGAVRMSLRRVIHDPSLITDDLVAEVCEERALPGHGRVTHRALRHNLPLFGMRRWRSSQDDARRRADDDHLGQAGPFHPRAHTPTAPCAGSPARPCTSSTAAATGRPSSIHASSTSWSPSSSAKDRARTPTTRGTWPISST